jgi:LysM repeat protein
VTPVVSAAAKTAKASARATRRATPSAAAPAVAGLLIAGLALLAPAAARADRVFVHVVRSGETLASIAQRYYGDPRRESVLVMENGLNVQGGADIVVGLRLNIPTVSYHRVAEGETWARVAERYYGDPRRTAALIDANGGDATQPDVGAELLIPYPLRHVAGQHDTINSVAQLYYGRTDAGGTLRRFNNLRGNRLNRGQVVLVPLADLVLSDEGKAIVGAEAGQPAPAGGDVRALQQRIDEQLPTLRELGRRGRFTEAVALGNRLLGAGELTGNQIVSIHRELGVAYVALEREDLAVSSFREVIARQPDAELDSIRTSPKVLAAFHAARRPPVAPGGTAAPGGAGATAAGAAAAAPGGAGAAAGGATAAGGAGAGAPAGSNGR